MLDKIIKKTPTLLIKLALLLSFAISGAYEAYLSLVLSNLFFPEITMSMTYLEYLVVTTISSWLLYELVVFIISRLILSLKHMFTGSIVELKNAIAVFTIILNIALGLVSLIFLCGDIYYDLFSLFAQVLLNIIVYYLAYLFIDKRFVKAQHRPRALLLFVIPLVVLNVINIVGGLI